MQSQVIRESFTPNNFQSCSLYTGGGTALVAVSGGAKHTLLLSQICYKLTEAETHRFFYPLIQNSCSQC